MMSKKGQAAMEFLMTYGWAILIAIIAIAALIAFGVLSPGKSLQNTCGTSNALMPQLGCKEIKVVGAANDANANLTIYIENGLGAELQSIVMNVSGCTANRVVTSLADGANDYWTFTTCDCTNGRYKGTIDFTYQLAGEQLPHTLTGVPLSARCEAA
jgi:uncharacterized protein (UPF0333 family)